jgi:hypothetical protein
VLFFFGRHTLSAKALLLAGFGIFVILQLLGVDPASSLSKVLSLDLSLLHALSLVSFSCLANVNIRCFLRQSLGARKARGSTSTPRRSSSSSETQALCSALV